MQCFSRERIFMKHREISLEINSKRSVKLEKGTIKFRNYLKKIAVPFKIYADFKSVLKKLQINDRGKNTSYTEKYNDHTSCSFGYKVVCIDDKFSKPAVLYRGKNAVNKFAETILKEYDNCKKVIKNILIKICHFNRRSKISIK